MRKIFVLVSLGTLGIWQSCETPPAKEQEEETTEVISSLPFQEIPLENLDAFTTSGSNWKVAGSVVSDFETEQDMQVSDGSGVLINIPSESDNSPILTAFEHGDIELDIDFMIPKGSNSGIYFQSRYELQIMDSWLVEDVGVHDCGSIYERWDESQPDGKKGYEGHAPRLNASKAPGLWQHYHVKFRAPRFDSTGVKISNAVFEEVSLNGIMIHENVELTGPTRGAVEENGSEVAHAPILIQGDHGPVAFRNIAYKLYGADTAYTSDLTYRYHEIEVPTTQMPNLDSLEVVETGSTELMDVYKLSKRQDGVAFRFAGNLQVPISGDYLFHLYSDDGSQMYIDGKLLVDHDGKHDLEPKRGLIKLDKGTHSIQIDYFNNNWGKGLILFYEGPQQEFRLLQGFNPYSSGIRRDPLLVEAQDAPEMIRSFVNYGTEKRTHAISVGDPSGLHYTYDLNNGALLKAWRGRFADVTEMWQGRGIDQLLVPQEMWLELNENIVAAKLPDDTAPYPGNLSPTMKPKGYAIDANDRPLFLFQTGKSTIRDRYTPGADKISLVRTVTIEGSDALFTRAGRGKEIKLVNDEFYSVDGQFFLRNDGSSPPIIREIDGQQELLYKLSENLEIQYSLIW